MGAKVIKEFRKLLEFVVADRLLRIFILPPLAAAILLYAVALVLFAVSALVH